MSPPILKRLGGTSEAAAWDAFVHDQPNGTFFHLSGW